MYAKPTDAAVSKSAAPPSQRQQRGFGMMVSRQLDGTIPGHLAVNNDEEANLGPASQFREMLTIVSAAASNASVAADAPFRKRQPLEFSSRHHMIRDAVGNIIASARGQGPASPH